MEDASSQCFETGRFWNVISRYLHVGNRVFEKRYPANGGQHAYPKRKLSQHSFCNKSATADVFFMGWECCSIIYLRPSRLPNVGKQQLVVTEHGMASLKQSSQENNHLSLVSPKVKAILYVAFGWGLILLLSTTSIHVSSEKRGLDAWLKTFTLLMTSHLIWLVMIPLIWKLAQRFPFEAQYWKTCILKYFLLGLATSFLFAALQDVLLGLMGKSHIFSSSLPHILQSHLLKSLPVALIVYCAILGTCLMVQNWKNTQDQKLQMSEMAHLLSQAKLSALKMQLHPHFLFNALNTISSYVERDPRATRTMIARLSELLRLSLNQEEKQWVTMEQELHFLQVYLDIEQVRMQERLTVVKHIDDDIRNALVPTLLLQPLVENAIRHGLNKKVVGGSIVITAHKSGSLLHLSICDNGPGLRMDGKDIWESGIGLKNTRMRLKHLYDAHASINIASEPNKGTEVTLSIPYNSQES